MRGIVEAEREVTDLAGKLLKLRISLVHFAEFHNAFAHVRCELVAQRAPRHSNDGEILRQQPDLLQVEERREQFALRQIARRAEDHHDPGVGNALACLGNLGQILGTYLHLHGCCHHSTGSCRVQSNAIVA